MDSKICLMVVLAWQFMVLIDGAALKEDSTLNQIDKQKYKRDLSGLWSEPLLEPWHAGSSGWDHSSGWKPIISSWKSYPRQTISAVLRKLKVPISFIPTRKYIPNHLDGIGHIGSIGHLGSYESVEPIHHIESIGSDILHLDGGFHGGHLPIASAGLIGHGVSLHAAPLLDRGIIGHSIPIHDSGFAVGLPHLIGGEKSIW